MRQSISRSFVFHAMGLILFFTSPVQPQNRIIETGLPYIRNFTPKEYGAHSQNWSIIQDRRGVIYVGNTNGILEYDGVSWRLIRPSGQANVVFSLAADENGRIYAGSYNDLGYLSPDSLGRMRYISLSDRLPESCRLCKNVWYTHTLDRSVYFMTPKYLFRYTTGEFQVWESATKFRKTFLNGGKFYVKQENLPLMELAGDSLLTVSGGDLLKNSYVTTILPYVEDTAFVGTLVNGFFRMRSGAVDPFPVPPLRLIVDSKCAGGLRLADGSFALNSYKNGVIVLDRNGALKTVVNMSTGLLNNFILSMFADRENGLWLATNNGISRIELPSRFSCYDEQLGLDGKVETLVRHGAALFAATSQGIYRMSDGVRPDIEFNKMPMRIGFVKIEGINTQCWNLLSVGRTLLAATRNGVYQIVRQRGTLIGFAEQNVFCLVRSKADSNRVFVGLSDGLASMYYRDGTGWIDEGRLKDFNQRIRWLAEDEFAELWMCTSHNGVWQASFNVNRDRSEDIWKRVELTRVDTSFGLPSMNSNRAFTVDGRLIWGTEDGVYAYDRGSRRFSPQRNLGPPPPKNTWLTVRLSEGENKNLWMVLEHAASWELGVSVHQHVNEYQWISRPFARFSTARINSILAEKDGVCWFGGNSGIIRYDAGIEKDYSQDYSALIRRVLINGDSTLYAGAADITDGLSVYTRERPVLEHGMNALRFEFAAPSFDVSESNRYQYLLDGFDEDWSDWTGETTKDYTNIPNGSYRFRVRARNIYQNISSEDGFTFDILPPWYRTVWAYIAYVLLFSLLFVLSVQWRSRHLERDKLALERLVAQRTEEVRVQAEKLKEMDKLKSRFFANISHEFRTPLTLIIDPLNEMIAGTYQGDSANCFKVMKRNAVRLLRLINQLLDLSRLESGGLTLQVKYGNIVPLIRGLVNSFSSIADRRNIELQCQVKKEAISLCFDKDSVEKILSNLLSNAFKFTPEGGRVSVTVLERETRRSSRKPKPEAPGRKLEKTKRNHIEIRIADTGIGIPDDRLPYIFDRFYSMDNLHMSDQAGSGIGLALTKELVELHHGEISVSNRKDGGTEFTVRLPLGRDHFCEDEFVREAPAEEALSKVPADTLIPDVVESEELETSGPGELPAADESDARNLILVVEDNTDVRHYIREYLASEYAVLEAPDGKRGVETAIEKIPDLIISDVMMPEMDGYELCRVLKENLHTNHIPIILLTAKAEDSDKIAGLKTGADDYLVKPFNSQELLTRIRNLISVRHRLQEKYKMEFLLQPEDVAVESIDDAFVKRACDVVEENMGNPDFSVELFADKIAMSRGNLHRKLKAVVNQSAGDFIRALRLKRAAQLLKQRTGTITEISFQVGFTSTAYFSKCFREQFGVSPSEYSKKRTETL